MKKDKQIQTLQIIEEAVALVRSGQASRASFCDRRGRLSKSKLELPCSTNSMISDPLCYQAYRELKFLVEEISLNLDQVKNEHAALIASVREVQRGTGIETRTELSKQAPALYHLINTVAESSSIFRLGGMCGGHAEFFYFSDEELIQSASAFSSLTDLKNHGGEIHRHIKGRRLDAQLMRAQPKFIGRFYVGLNQERFRSIPELVLGNLMMANGVNFLHDSAFAPPEWKGKRALEPDFYFPDANFILELAQSKGGTGTRRVKYDQRTARKVACYDSVPTLRYEFLVVDEFFTATGFNVPAFLYKARELLLGYGINPGPIPHNCAGLRSDDIEVKSFYLSAPVDVLIDHFVNDHQLRGIADFQNNFSCVKHLIRLRDDRNEIMSRIRQIGKSWTRRSKRSGQVCDVPQNAGS